MGDGLPQLVDLGPAERRAIDLEHDAVELLVGGGLVDAGDQFGQRFDVGAKQARRGGPFRIGPLQLDLAEAKGFDFLLGVLVDLRGLAGGASEQEGGKARYNQGPVNSHRFKSPRQVAVRTFIP